MPMSLGLRRVVVTTQELLIGQFVLPRLSSAWSIMASHSREVFLSASEVVGSAKARVALLPSAHRSVELILGALLQISGLSGAGLFV